MPVDLSDVTMSFYMIVSSTCVCNIVYSPFTKVTTATMQRAVSNLVEDGKLPLLEDEGEALVGCIYAHTRTRYIQPSSQTQYYLHVNVQVICKYLFLHSAHV